MRMILPAERVIVSIDPSPADPLHGRLWGYDRTVEFARETVLSSNIRITIKSNSVLRASGYGLIDHLHAIGVRVFADLKLVDIRSTLQNDGAYLDEARPEFLTASCTAGAKALAALKARLPRTRVLGFTVPSTFGDSESLKTYGCPVQDAVLRLARTAGDAGLDGLVCSGRDLPLLRKEFGDAMEYCVVNVRPKSLSVSEDDQNLERATTPHEAICGGATNLVIGRPITQAADPVLALRSVIGEIEQTLP